MNFLINSKFDNVFWGSYTLAVGFSLLAIHYKFLPIMSHTNELSKVFVIVLYPMPFVICFLGILFFRELHSRIETKRGN